MACQNGNMWELDGWFWFINRKRGIFVGIFYPSIPRAAFWDGFLISELFQKQRRKISLETLIFLCANYRLLIVLTMGVDDYCYNILFQRAYLQISSCLQNEGEKMPNEVLFQLYEIHGIRTWLTYLLHGFFSSVIQQHICRNNNFVSRHF